MSIQRIVIAIWHFLMLAALIAIFLLREPGSAFHWIWIPMFAVPALVLLVTVASISSSARGTCYWLLAVACIPNAAAGLFSGIGWLSVFSLIFLIWAARREKPNIESVQA